MAIDPSIPLGVQQYNPMQPLSALMGVMGQRQAISASQTAQQGQQIQNAGNQMSLQERQATAPVLADPTKWTDPKTGDIDLNSLSSQIMPLAPTTGMEIVARAAQAQQARTQARSMISQQSDADNARVGSAIASLNPETATSDDVDKLYRVLKSIYPGKDMQNVLDAQQKNLTGVLQNTDPKIRALGVIKASRMFLPPQTQQDMNTPSVATNDNGATYTGVNLKPGVSGVPQFSDVQGMGGTKQLPPTTPTIDPATLAPGVIGPHSPAPPNVSVGAPSGRPVPFDFAGVQGPGRANILHSIANDATVDPRVRFQAHAAMMAGTPPQPLQASAGAPQPSGFVQTGPAPGQAEGITGPVAVANQHYAQVQADAQSAGNRIASLQTIKQQIPTAIMGGGGPGDFLRGVSRTFGFASDAATANDVMAKNLAVLAAQGGNTDAARSLGEMGNPSYHMTADAANRAVDQLAGIEAKKQAAGSFFTGTSTNSPDYTNKVQMWNRYGDPRAFEYAAKSPQDRAVMRAEMQKAGTWKTLQDNMSHMAAMGIEPQ